MMGTEIATMSEPSEPVMEPGPELTLSDREAELILTYTEAGASPEVSSSCWTNSITRPRNGNLSSSTSTNRMSLRRRGRGMIHERIQDLTDRG